MPDTQESFANLRQSVSQASQTIGSIFKERLDKKQYDDFLNGPTKDLESRLKQAQDLMLDDENDDAPGQAISMMKGALDSYMTEGIRYKDNQYIMAKVQSVFQTNNNMLNDLFAVKFKQAKTAADTAKAQADADLKGAQTEEARAKAGYWQARAEGKIGKDGKAAGAGKEGLISYFSGQPGSIDPNAAPEDRVRAAYTNVLTNMARPGDAAQEKGIKDLEAATRRSMAQEELASRVGRGETKTLYAVDEMGRTKEANVPWSTSNPEDLKLIENQIDPENVKRRVAIQKVREEANVHGLQPDEVDQVLGPELDPTKARPTSPITRSLKEEEVGKLLMGAGGWDSLSDTKRDETGKVIKKAPPTSIAEAANRLPDNFNDFQGPLKDAFLSSVPVLQRVKESGQLKNYNDVVEFLEEVSGVYIGQTIGAGKPNAEVAEGVRNSREAGIKLGRAAAQRYAPVFAAQLGITLPKQKTEETAPKEESGVRISNEWLRKVLPIDEIGGHIEGAKKIWRDIKE